MKHIIAIVLFAAFSLAETAFCQSTDAYRNGTITFSSTSAINYSFGGITVSSTQGTVITEPFAISGNGGTDPSSTQGTVITEPFAVQSPKTNSTNYDALVSYLSTVPFTISKADGKGDINATVSYNVNESTNDNNLPSGDNCGVTSAAVELVDVSAGFVLAVQPLPAFCKGQTSLSQTSFSLSIPGYLAGDKFTLRLNVQWQGGDDAVAYTSFATDSLVNIDPPANTNTRNKDITWKFNGDSKKPKWEWHDKKNDDLGKETASDAAPASSIVLGQNYPNPAQAATTSITLENVNAPVSLNVYDALGRMVADLSGQVAPTAGFAKVDFDVTNLRSGVYFYRLQAANGSVQMRQLIVRK
jgi:hypothetical protein